MTDDLVKRLRTEMWDHEYKIQKEAADRIEHLENRCANLLVGNGALNIRSDKLEEALQEVAKINNRRDRFSSEIDAIIINALGEEP
jgi:hypothetical protein